MQKPCADGRYGRRKGADENEDKRFFAIRDCHGVFLCCMCFSSCGQLRSKQRCENTVLFVCGSDIFRYYGVLDGVRGRSRIGQEHAHGHHGGDRVARDDFVHQISQISRFLLRNFDEIPLVFLLYSAMHCSRRVAHDNNRYGTKGRATDFKTVASTFFAGGGADIVCFHQRRARAGVFLCERAEIFQRNIQMGVGILSRSDLDMSDVRCNRRGVVCQMSRVAKQKKGVDTPCPVRIVHRALHIARSVRS